MKHDPGEVFQLILDMAVSINKRFLVFEVFFHEKCVNRRRLASHRTSLPPTWRKKRGDEGQKAPFPDKLPQVAKKTNTINKRNVTSNTNSLLRSCVESGRNDGVCDVING